METASRILPAQRTAEKRHHISWAKKGIPLNNSTFFNKAKHSEEWHRDVGATAGVLRPSDSKFPFGFLRNHTDTYLKRKGKITSTDTDVRLAILVNAHEARDIAVAAVAHAMTAKSLRALLHVELNVAQGSYWGLETWLQCLIAANIGNPASVTDLEAQWARTLLPFAVEGAHAAALVLQGVSNVLITSRTPNLNVVPQFLTLWRRAITDYSAQLEGFRLKFEWLPAQYAVQWLTKLQNSSPSVTPPGHLLPEHLLDSQLPIWRAWARWTPNIERISRLAQFDNTKLAMIPDIIALEGPDILTGKQDTLRDGLVAQYESERPWIRIGVLVIQVPDRTKNGLRNTLERIARNLDSVLVRKAIESGYESLFKLFRNFTVIHPITVEGLDIIEAAIKVQYTLENDVYNAVRKIHNDRYTLNGHHVLTFRSLLNTLDEPQAGDLTSIFLQPWLLQGIENCLHECRIVVGTLMGKSLPWFHLALELHEFCDTLKRSKHNRSLVGPDVFDQLEYVPSKEQIKTVSEIYVALQALQADKQIKTSSVEQKSQPGAADQLKEPEKTSQPLEKMIEDYCIQRLLEPSKVSQQTECTLNPILRVWKSTTGDKIDNDRRSLAILVSQNMNNNNQLYCKCLNDIATGTQWSQSPEQTQNLLAVIRQVDLNFEQAIVDFTKFLSDQSAMAQCWKDLLYGWIEQQGEAGVTDSSKFVDHCLKTMKVTQWLSFIQSLQKVFADLSDLQSLNSEERNFPSILKPQLLDWTTQISRYKPVLTKLEDVLEKKDAINCILTCSEGVWSKNVLTILERLESAEGKPAETAMYKLAGMLDAEKRNDWEIRELLLNWQNADPEILLAFEKIFNASQGFLDIPGLPAPAQPAPSPVLSKRSLVGKVAATGVLGSKKERKESITSLTPSSTSTATAPMPTRVQVPLAVAEVMVTGLIQQRGSQYLQKCQIEAFAKFLSLKVYRTTVPEDKLKAAIQFWDRIEQEIMKEAERLEKIQKALKESDPNGTALLLKELGIPDHTLFDEEMNGLPSSLRDVVEQIGDDEVEISFPLKEYTELQRSGMGIPAGAKTLLLRLFVDYSGSMSPSFCLHFDNEKNLDSIEHSPRICSQGSAPPKEKFCTSVGSAFTWQLSRIIHTQLRSGNIHIAALHSALVKKMKEMSLSCISCDKSHSAPNTHLRRSTPCHVVACAQLWYQLPLDVRVPEIRTDLFAVDMMLTTVYVAATVNKSELLPNCPIRNNETVKTILNSLPQLSVIRDAVNISTVLNSYHKDAEKLISWACVHFRGYLTTATGRCKIPNLPTGTHQFVLANAAPGLENNFVSKLSKSNPKTMVLFHGTSLDRLPAILSQGLKICSGTSLQRTGAAHGKGIYMAEDPQTSFTYAPSTLSWRNSGLPNMRMLLGCEVAGNGRKVSGSIHVITDETSVMVRYVFFFTNYAACPAANIIIPAMASGMQALRGGTA